MLTDKKPGPRCGYDGRKKIGATSPHACEPSRRLVAPSPMCHLGTNDISNSKGNRLAAELQTKLGW